METKLKMKLIPRSTNKALEFLRQVRFLPDFDPDRAAVCPVRRKVTKNHRNFTIERPINIGDFWVSVPVQISRANTLEITPKTREIRFQQLSQIVWELFFFFSLFLFTNWNTELKLTGFSPQITQTLKISEDPHNPPSSFHSRRVKTRLINNGTQVHTKEGPAHWSAPSVCQGGWRAHLRCRHVPHLRCADGRQGDVLGLQQRRPAWRRDHHHSLHSR
jgi:hypothetical protein